ncbi:host attachment protein [Agrobacterium sp. a22-2]|uniref:baeRF12 domain-containing protein n=1 Tax=Agrobacterium sp. a22-2 TaxID=2283840 RepID=UPI001446DC5D|nr:host attachment family protein [Agrobacterium sp. a22-2]NKN37919.1 host attachment protein [Agrobacterium sp. a22-2]
MNRNTIAAKAWVIVCDGAKALFLQNVGTAQSVNLAVVEQMSQPDEAAHDLGSDRPGRAFQSEGSARSAMEETDWHETAEADFLLAVAGRLAALVETGDIQDMILVAPPKALGQLRPALGAGINNVLRAEIAKDYVKLPVADIEKHLAALKAA